MTNKIPTADLSRIAASALQEVLATQFKLLAVSALPDEMARAATDSRCLTGSVDIEGERMSGSLRLQLPEAWVHKINASLLKGRDAVSIDEDDASDLTGELCNMIAGRIAASLAGAGYASTLSTPRVIRGQPLQLEGDAGCLISRSNWACESQVLQLTVFLTHKTT